MGLPGVIAAVGASLIGGHQAKKGAQAAAGASVEASRLGIEAQERATEQLRQDLAPYSGFGLGALGPLSQAIGIPLVQGQVQAQPASTGIVDFQQSQGLPVPKPSFNKGDPGFSVKPGPGGIPKIIDRGAFTPQARATTGAAEGVAENTPDHARIQNKLDTLQKIIDGRIPGNESTRSVAREEMQRLTRTLSEMPITPESAATLESLGQGGLLPTDVFQQFATGGIDFGPTEQQQATVVPQAPAAPFNSRAEAIMGGPNNPLLQQAIQMRQESPENALLSQAAAMRQDGSEILQNPLLRAMQDDVTRRLMANQAARGKLGSGGTAEELQNRLIPQALAFREQEIAGLTGLGGLQEDLRERQLVGLTNLGLTGEDIRQREVGDLFRAAGLGQASAARTGAAGLTAAGNIANLQQAAGAAQGQGALGSAYANNLMLGGVLQGAQQFFQPTVPTSMSPSGARL